MQIIIEIPEGAYEEICKARFPIQDGYRLVSWIKDGTPLLKGYERLGDLDAICKDVIKSLGIKEANSKKSEKMTREEAYKYGTEWLKDEYLDSEDRAFITMALEALKQESCEDAISQPVMTGEWVTSQTQGEVFMTPEVKNIKIDLTESEDVKDCSTCSFRERL